MLAVRADARISGDQKRRMPGGGGMPVVGGGGRGGGHPCFYLKK